MNYAVLFILLLTSLLFAHSDAGEEKVTETESLLWLREQLQLTAPVYKEVQSMIQEYRRSTKFVGAQTTQDSILLELTKTIPSGDRISELQKRLAQQTQQQSEQFVAHLKEIKHILRDDQFAAYISVSGNVYQDLPFELPRYTSEHLHVDGVIHAHGHEHPTTGQQPSQPHTHSQSHSSDHTHGIEPATTFNQTVEHPDVDAVTKAAPLRKSKRHSH